MRETTKHAAEALQVIRRTIGDVHGTKPAYSRIAYDSIKWASAICHCSKASKGTPEDSQCLIPSHSTGKMRPLRTQTFIHSSRLSTV
jgi:hypothetical protein